MTTNANPNLTITAAWERSTLATSRDDTALLLTVTANRPHRPEIRPRAAIDLAFVLDRSGSMSGPKLDLVKTAVIEALAFLTPEDRVSLVIFDNEIDVIQPLTQADAGVRHAIQAALRQRGIGTTTMGVGVGFDEILLTSLAEAGGGTFHYIGDESRIPAVFASEIGGLTELASLRPQLNITLALGTRGELLNAFPNERHGKTITIDLRDLADRDRVELVMMVTHRGRTWGDTTSLTATARYIDPDTRATISFPIVIPPLTLVPDARHAPVNDAVAIARAREQARLDQREALRLDREGRFAESRLAFASSHQRLATADRDASARGYTGISADAIADLREESTRAHGLASAPAAPLDERTHKERAARHARTSRGDRT